MQFRHLWDMRLDKHDRFFRADSHCQPVQCHLIGVLGQFLGGFQRGEGVQVHDAVDAIIILLQGNVVLHGAQVIAQVLATGGAGS